MKYKGSAFFLLSAFTLATLPAYAQHGGGGGHAGGFGGHGVGHLGGSSGHVSGSHSGGHGNSSRSAYAHGTAPPPAGAMMMHGRIVQLSNPRFGFPRPNKPHQPITEFGFGVSSRHFLHGDLGCFDFGYLFEFDPFCFGGVFPGVFGPAEFDDPGDPGAFANSDGSEQGESNIAEDLAYQTSVNNDLQDSSKPTKPKAVVLLQLKDGSMYGLTDYWVVDGRLRYVTDYGGSNSIPLDRIDLPKSIQLNAERGVKFYVQSDSEQR